MRKLSNDEIVNDEQLPGQMNIFDFIRDDKVYPVIIKGFCDDAYCPKCESYLPEWKHEVMDCERCPNCGVRLDWTPWHRANDEVETDG